MYQNAYVEVDNRIIEENARFMTENFPHKYNIAVVKGNAYGHGYGIVPALIKGGMNAFAVSTLDEALEVRKYTDLPIIMLQPVSKEYFNIASEQNISLCVNCIDTFKEILDSNLKLKLQIKVNSGMNRLGFKDKKELEAVVNKINESESLTLEGIFTHFHSNGLQDIEYKNDKLRFERLTEGIDLTKIPMVHVDRTQTVFLHDTPAYANGARIGISLYGFSTVYPFRSGVKGKIRKLERKLKNKKNKVEDCKPIKVYDLKKAFSLYTKVIQVNDVEPEEYVGYGLLHKAEAKEKIAVIDIGYGDGIGRKRYLSDVAINGKKFKIIGEVGMGMCEVLVDDSVKRGNIVTVIGGEINISDVTRKLGTTLYEVMTGIDTKIPRHYIN